MYDVIDAISGGIGTLAHIGWMPYRENSTATRMCASAQIEHGASVRLAVLMAGRRSFTANFGLAVQQIPSDAVANLGD